jgi:hypothetical protein
MRKALVLAVKDQMQAFKTSLQEAVAAVDRPLSPAEQDTLLRQHKDDVSWLDLDRLGRTDPELAWRRWEDICQAAIAELESGHRMARTQATSPWEQAQVLALRWDLANQLKPQGGAEWQLVDTMALAQANWFTWLEALKMWFSMGTGRAGPDCKDELGRSTPRLTEAEAIKLAGEMADRFHRMFLRTMRAFCDLRRHPPPTVVVQNAGQVNVGGQQVNVAQG